MQYSFNMCQRKPQKWMCVFLCLCIHWGQLNHVWPVIEAKPKQRKPFKYNGIYKATAL